ncbi:hypothetical protein M6B38_345590 [Iris pallida]|uniref:Uncharacterized protein n=1 Tax=Iris pallida TaxID=29817 RepID=A0AAX6GUV7_IRIPA|nr:hypothetical protein M6B38_345590 [Iris pallida]
MEYIILITVFDVYFLTAHTRVVYILPAFGVMQIAVEIRVGAMQPNGWFATGLFLARYSTMYGLQDFKPQSTLFDGVLQG